jgi:hypothetical protein
VWDVQTFQEFAKLSTKLTHGAFLFTGLELFESLNSKQLSTLLRHSWKIKEVHETELAPHKAETRLEETSQEQQDAEKTKTLHHVTESQKKSLDTVSSFCKAMCVILKLDNNKLAENQAYDLRHTFDPFDVTNLPHTIELLRLKLTSYLKGLVEENQRQDPNYKPSGDHIQLHEHAFRLKNIRGGMTCYGLMVELSRNEKLLRQTLSDQVCVRETDRQTNKQTDRQTDRQSTCSRTSASNMHTTHTNMKIIFRSMFPVSNDVL